MTHSAHGTGPATVVGEACPPDNPGQLNPEQRDPLTLCVHCGLCLEVCPTYQLSGDENNSPRGRLRMWKEEAEGRFAADPWTATYTEACVGCLACEPACPANVPYAELLEHVRHEHVVAGRTRVPFSLKVGAMLAERPALFQWLMTPVRLLRSWGLSPHRFLFPGSPAVGESTAEYARRLVARYRPTGPRVALLTGCLMEAVFREINFATVRVLVDNNVNVVVPPDQGCCGAMQEHLGLPGIEALREQSRATFTREKYDAVLCNSSGCGLAMAKSLAEAGAAPVRDVLDFLGELQPRVQPHVAGPHVYVDLPCHLIHGQRVAGIPESVLNATGLTWELAPQARECCGSGGVYKLRQPETAQEILRKKSAFLESAAGSPVILATSNHVCLMQWNSARTTGLVHRPFHVRHVIQLLDPQLPSWGA
jgi:glycolate oxidase iron-sulfur subunit